MTTYEITFNEMSETGKFLIDFLNKNKESFVINDQYKMTKEEFDAKCDEARQQWKRGEFTRVKREDLKKFLGLE
jgi:hypothetical protein